MHSPTVWIKRLAVFLCAATLLILIPALNGRAQKLQSLSGQKVLIVRGDHDYPPYEFMKNGKPAGFNIDLIRAVAKELNLKIKIDLGPWNEVRQELEDGKIDILSGMYYSGDRDKQVDFSVPHVFISYALFVRDDSDISSLQDLSGKDVLVQKGDLANDLLKEREETVNIIPVPDISDVLQILSAGEYDCALLPRIQGLYFIRQQHLSNLRNIHINFPLQPYCFAVREGNESLLHALNEGLNIVKSTGEYQHIYRKWFGLFEKKSFWETYRTLIISFSIFLVILFFATMWVWSLRRQVRIRTARQLKTEERYSLLFHRIPVGVFHYDTDLVITDFNGRFSEILQSDSHSLQNLQMDKLKDKRVLPAISAVLHGKEGIYEGPYDTTTSSVTIYVSLRTAPIYDEFEKIQGGVGIVEDVSVRMQAEAALKESEEKYRQLIQHSGDAIYLLFNGRLELVNHKFKQMFGLTEEDILNPDFEIMELVAPESRDKIRRLHQTAVPDKQYEQKYEFKAFKKNGDIIEVEASVSYVRYKEGMARQGILRDITERKFLEEQLRQAQKMEAIGRLAGGIAHDFNNLLTIIMGYSELLLARLKENSELQGYLSHIFKAADRAELLTRQLLAFSRKQVLQPEVLNLNDLILEISQMLGRLLQENIEMRPVLENDLKNIEADPGQIQQVIMNLTVNAKDAMPEGGTITIKTANVILDEEFSGKDKNLQPGNYVMLTISDDGAGITRENLPHIFEPFFTTKPKGQGTGLGLSTVYGIVQQSSGHIRVKSETGEGATFTLYFPAVDEAVSAPQEKKMMNSDLQGNETILLVEDEKDVRIMVEETLIFYGYRVLEASGGGEALRHFEREAETIDLLLTDVIMPGMSGKALSDQLTDRRPELKVLFMSGYTDNAINRHGILENSTNFIQKPFTPVVLLEKVREVLDQP